MKNQTFGIEIEMTGMTRYDAAKAVAKYFGTTENYVGGTYSAYEVKDQTGRIWKLVSDASIRPETKRAGQTAGSDYKVEMVSPICRYGDRVQVLQLDNPRGQDKSLYTACPRNQPPGKNTSLRIVKKNGNHKRKVHLQNMADKARIKRRRVQNRKTASARKPKRRHRMER